METQPSKKIRIVLSNGYPKIPVRSKRIVPKHSYVRSASLKTSIKVAGTGLRLLACLYTGGAAIGFYSIATIIQEGVADNVKCGVFAVILSGLLLNAYYFQKLSIRLFQRAGNIDPGIPLTRANTADLPAPDSLVRASQEPAQAQETILLRAAAEGRETPPEQLVRAVNRQK